MIYFDAAATTLQKPPQVKKALLYAMDHYASPGRGGHRPGNARFRRGLCLSAGAGSAF